jgi:hypothetical protein
LNTTRVLLFDVFGTVVDWRGSLIREGRALAAEHRLQADWAASADPWRPCSGHMQLRLSAWLKRSV